LRLILITTIICILLAQNSIAQDEYTIKPGDIITVTVWERQTLSSTVTVDANGNITLPVPIGEVKVAGLTTQQISDLLTERIEEYIINPTIFVSVTPAQTFMVHIIGEVVSPNFYSVPDGTSVQELITRAGGLTQFADIKRIRLIHQEGSSSEDNEAKERIIDFSRFRDQTELSANPILKANDVVVIPRLPGVKPVHIIGAVQNPGVFTLDKPSPLMETLSLAGGLSDDADLEKITIINSSDGKYSMRTINFERFLTGEDLAANQQISPSEAVFVPKLEDLVEKKRILVNVAGQVTNPGGVQILEGGRLFDAIFAAGGLADEPAIDKVIIIHPHATNPVKNEVNLQKFMTTGDLKDNPELIAGDIVFVPMSGGAKKIIPPVHSPFFPTISLNVFGEVQKPNTYQISADSNLLDILRLAGGPTGDADLRRVMIIRGTHPQPLLPTPNPSQEGKGEEKEQRLLVDLEKVLQEGELNLLPLLLTDDTIFVPKIKPHRNIWGTIVRIAADVSTIAIAVLIVTGSRYYR